MPTETFTAALAERIIERKLTALDSHKKLIDEAVKNGLSHREIADIAIETIPLTGVPKARVTAAISALLSAKA